MKYVKGNGTIRAIAESFDDRDFIHAMIRRIGSNQKDQIPVQKLTEQDSVACRGEEAHSIIFHL